jgi:hypothetical protein
MRRGAAALAVVLLALAGGAMVSTATAAPQSATAATPSTTPATATAANGTAGNGTITTPPTVNVSINGESVSDGEFRVLREETTAVLRAEVAAESGRSLDTVLVQVGDEIVVDREDPGDGVTINRSLPIGAGNNTIRVVAEDDRDRLTSTRFLLYLERVPPAMDLESPVDTVPDPYQYENVVTNRTLTDWSGRFRDLTGFRDATVSFVRPGSGDVYRVFRVGPDPSFDEEVLLRYGRTNVRVVSTDTLGNTHITTFTTRVIDERGPSVDLGVDETPLESPWYNVSATVTDNVWVRNVSVDVLHLGRTPYQEFGRHYEPVEPERYRHSRERRSVSFEQGVRLLTGRNIVSVTAVDHLGQETVRTFEVDYYPERERPPAVSVLRNATRIEGNESAAVSAVVTDANGDLRRVLVEVEDLDRQQLTDVESYRLDNESTFLFERSLDIGPGVSEVQITAIDGERNLTSERLYIDARAGRQTQDPPPGYEDVANDSDDGTADPSLPDDPTTATPDERTTDAPVTEGTPGSDGTTTANVSDGTTTANVSDGTSGGGAATGAPNDEPAAGGGGLLAGLTSLPVLAALAVVLVGGGYYVWIKLTRV